MEKRLNPHDAAKRFIEDHFPHCDAALLSGSVVRGEATDTSDLDIIVFDQLTQNPFRESHIMFGWPIEVFVHNFVSYRKFFESDVLRARPSLPRMVHEGVPIKKHHRLEAIKNEATALLSQGPPEWTEQEIRLKRYFITDTLDDFIGSSNRYEEIFIANKLAELLHEFVLRTNKRWIGSSKWVYKEMNMFDTALADTFMQAFDSFYKSGNKELVINLTDAILKPHQGRLFDGFHLD